MGKTEAHKFVSDKKHIKSCKYCEYTVNSAIHWKILIEPKQDCSHELNSGTTLCGICYNGWKQGIHCQECPHCTPVEEAKCKNCNGKGFNTTIMQASYMDGAKKGKPYIDKITCSKCKGTGHIEEVEPEPKFKVNASDIPGPHGIILVDGSPMDYKIEPITHVNPDCKCDCHINKMFWHDQGGCCPLANINKQEECKGCKTSGHTHFMEPKCDCCSKDERTCVCTNDCIKSTKSEDHIPDVGEKVYNNTTTKKDDTTTWQDRFDKRFINFMSYETKKDYIKDLKQFIQQELDKVIEGAFKAGIDTMQDEWDLGYGYAKQQLQEELIEKIEGEKVFEGFQWKGGINKKLLVKDKIYNKALSHIIDLIKSKI